LSVLIATGLSDGLGFAIHLGRSLILGKSVLLLQWLPVESGLSWAKGFCMTVESEGLPTVLLEWIIESEYTGCRILLNLNFVSVFCIKVLRHVFPGIS